MSWPPKPRAPPALQKVLDADVYFTNKFNMWANNVPILGAIRTYGKALEISCHGIPWFACWMAFMWLTTNNNLVQMQINLLLGLIIDILLIAVIKAYTRRQRPKSNRDDMFGQIGPDQFSFPSGHATRAVFVTYFFIYLYSVNVVFGLMLLVWCVAVSLSRVLIGRHHILDVTAGVILGLFEGWLVGMLWLNKDICAWLWSWLSDEKLDGGEFHV